ncbi:hypothetical protein H4R33_005896 [Dimargaris cristalligena]|uniref:Glycosyltransferase family 25-domain-containing protein n=1 Tax=Dimargaris cristalligena TaxID=215637 RepID=A0A4V1J4I9_9FUNG|nr:hypothetical protein H4R33_005896 [Dimargaris cristalligena]RKP35719.1 glycosyltransferase family 25-domain-containing protein [Dimargaris cristalligena]|eukprot:RKP35719.1 glycosyltransferase family 25-domain-containing protein [Dimargaris cristalligena]
MAYRGVLHQGKAGPYSTKGRPATSPARYIVLGLLFVVALWLWFNSGSSAAPAVSNSRAHRPGREHLRQTQLQQAESQPPLAQVQVQQAPPPKPQAIQPPAAVKEAPALATSPPKPQAIQPPVVAKAAPAAPVGKGITAPASTSTSASVRDRKMGFDEIFVINLKRRTDRRAKIALQADFLGIEVKFMEAATPDTVGFIPPYKQRSPTMSGNRLACWRSHMNIYLEMVERKLDRALIMEDDVDMDLSLPRDLPLALAKLPENEWDTFFVGHCSLTEKSHTVVDSQLGLYETSAPYCAHGYAVSRRGARRLLFHMSNAATAIDFHLIGLIKANLVKSYSFDPPRIVQPRESDNPSDIPESTDLPPNQHLKHSTLQAVRRFVHETKPRESYFVGV